MPETLEGLRVCILPTTTALARSPGPTAGSSSLEAVLEFLATGLSPSSSPAPATEVRFPDRLAKTDAFAIEGLESVMDWENTGGLNRCRTCIN